MKIVTASGSIRGSRKNRELIEDLARTKGGIPELLENIRRVTDGEPVLSNSEILAAAGMMGALQRGAEVEYLGLTELFDRKEAPVFELVDLNGQDEVNYIDTLDISAKSLDHLCGKVEGAQGVLLTTPVYFGDRSSVANKLLQVTAQQNLLDKHIFGVNSVGAKRNGGQETCDIYSMIEALSQGALVVGNGPPTSQYGGTAVGGNKSHVLEDEWGLVSSYGTGLKVAHASDIMVKGADAPSDTPVIVTILLTIDTSDGFLMRYLEDLTAQVQKDMPAVEFNILRIVDKTIFRCLGCVECPRGKDKDTPRCAIKDPEDYVEVVRKATTSSDAVIVAGLNLIEAHRLIHRYQVLTERMRYMRRNNFELTDVLLCGLTYHQFSATSNSIHSMKVLTSYIRHNTTVHRPIDVLEHQGTILESGLESLLDFCRTAQIVKVGRSRTPKPTGEYEKGGLAGGYT